MRRIKEIAQRSPRDRVVVIGERRLDVDVAPIGEMDGDRLVRLADLDRNAVVFGQQPDLLGEIASKEVRPCHAGLVHAGTGDEAISQTRIETRMSLRRDSHERITGAHARGKRLAVDVGFKTLAQKMRVALVDLLQAADRGRHVGERFGRNGLRSLDGHVRHVRSDARCVANADASGLSIMRATFISRARMAAIRRPFLYGCHFPAKRLAKSLAHWPSIRNTTPRSTGSLTSLICY